MMIYKTRLVTRTAAVAAATSCHSCRRRRRRRRRRSSSSSNVVGLLSLLLLQLIFVVQILTLGGVGVQACTVFAVGRNATIDKSVMISHSNDDG